MEKSKKEIKYFYIALYALILFVLILSIVLSKLTNEPLHFFFRDISTTTETPFYIGLASHFGNFLWAFLSIVCLYNFYLLYNLVGFKYVTKFYFFSALFVLLLTIDDILLIHEHAAYELFRISQKYIYGFYFLIMISYLLVFYKYILNTRYKAFVIGLIFFALSIFIDYAMEIFHLSRNLILLEDGLKFFGIASWIIYFAKLGLTELEIAYKRYSL